MIIIRNEVSFCWLYSCCIKRSMFEEEFSEKKGEDKQMINECLDCDDELCVVLADGKLIFVLKRRVWGNFLLTSCFPWSKKCRKKVLIFLNFFPECYLCWNLQLSSLEEAHMSSFKKSTYSFFKKNWWNHHAWIKLYLNLVS